MPFPPPLNAPLTTGLAPEPAIPVLERWFGSWQITVGRRALASAELEQSYDRCASTWTRTIERLGVGRAYEDLMRDVVADGAPGRVLDAGVGTGALSLALAQAADEPFHLDAVDLSPAMLDQAYAHLTAVGVAAEVHHADIQALPFADETFDLVMAAHVLEHLADPAWALAELHRVLKPGGRVLVCLTQQTLFGFYVQLKWRTHRVTGGQAVGWLRHAGFTDATSRPLCGRGCLSRMSIACQARKKG